MLCNSLNCTDFQTLDEGHLLFVSGATWTWATHSTLMSFHLHKTCATSEVLEMSKCVFEALLTSFSFAKLCAHNFGKESKHNVNAPCLQIIRSSMIIGCRGQGGIVVGARLALMAPCKNSTKTPFKRPCKCMALILWFSAHFLAIRVLLFQVNGQFLG